MELLRGPSIQALSYSHQSVLELHECTLRNFWNLRSTRTSSCYFLHTCVEANHSLKILVLLGLQMLSAILDISYSNELLRQFLAHLDHNVVPIS